MCDVVCDIVSDVVSGSEGSGKVKGLIFGCLGVWVTDRQTDGRTDRHLYFLSRFCN